MMHDQNNILLMSKFYSCNNVQEVNNFVYAVVLNAQPQVYVKYSTRGVLRDKYSIREET